MPLLVYKDTIYLIDGAHEGICGHCDGELCLFRAKSTSRSLLKHFHVRAALLFSHTVVMSNLCLNPFNQWHKVDIPGSRYGMLRLETACACRPSNSLLCFYLDIGWTASQKMCKPQLTMAEKCWIKSQTKALCCFVCVFLPSCVYKMHEETGVAN